MKIDLNDLEIFWTPEPIEEWDCGLLRWKYYGVFGFHKGVYAGQVTVQKVVKPRNEEEGLDYAPGELPNPFIGGQETEDEFRGNGICGKLIIAANDIFAPRFREKLCSDTHFLKHHEAQARRVWEKLEEQRLAKYLPATWDKKGRWVML